MSRTEGHRGLGQLDRINATTASSLGISPGDLVEVASTRGTLRLPAVISPGIRPDQVAIPLEHWHKGVSRHASDRGENPLALLGLVDGSEQAVWNATRVRMTRIKDRA